MCFLIQFRKPSWATHRFRDDTEGWDEEFVAHNCEGDEHVNESDEMEDDGTPPSLFDGEEIGGEKGFIPDVNGLIKG